MIDEPKVSEFGPLALVLVAVLSFLALTVGMYQLDKHNLISSNIGTNFRLR